MENKIETISGNNLKDNFDEPWKLRQKTSFRFAFLFLGLTSIINWHLSIFFSYIAWFKPSFDIAVLFHFFAAQFYWIDKYIFHSGYDPKIHASFPQDNHFATVFYLTVFLISCIGSILWGVIGRNKINYNKLFFWFNIYLRYTLAITMIGYGLIKFIPVQMSWPSVSSMLTPYGEHSRFDVLWNFMGVSPGYMRLTGGFEIIGGLLLLSRRTTLFGYLFLLTILINVVALNWFYNVPVKMYSTQLMVYNLFLLAPYANKLFHFFYYNKIIIAHEKQYYIKTTWKKNSFISILVFIPLLFLLSQGLGAYKRFSKDALDKKSEKLYNVTYFIATDTLPPLTTDTLCWKRLMIRGNTVVVCNMKDEMDYYDCDVDSTKHSFTFHDNPDTATWKVFQYAYPSKDELQLTGKWKEKDIKVLMKSSPIDSMYLNKEEIKLVQD